MNNYAMKILANEIRHRFFIVKGGKIIISTFSHQLLQLIYNKKE